VVREASFPGLPAGFLSARAIYVVVGLLVANSHHFFAKPIVSAVLAVVLWPVVLLGVNLHIK
jgi:hypothetical protein